MTLPHRASRSRLTLTITQRRAIADVASTLPSRLRHSFLLRVGSTLRMSAQNGWCTDPQVSEAINVALRQLQVAG